MTEAAQLLTLTACRLRKNQWIPACAGMTGNTQGATLQSFPRRRESIGRNMAADGWITSKCE